MNFFGWQIQIRRKPPVVPTENHIEIVKREIYDITADQWRSDPELIKVAAKVLSDIGVRQMLAVCRNDHLGKFTLDARLPDAIQLAHAHRAHGMGIMLNTFESLGTPLTVREAPQATYDPANWEYPEKPSKAK